MIPLKTLLAVTCTTAFLRIATLPNDQPSDNPSAMDAADPIDTRTPAGIYAEYFPSPEADGTGVVAPRLQRNLQTNPVFATDSSSPIDVRLRRSFTCPSTRRRPPSLSRGVKRSTSTWATGI